MKTLTYRQCEEIEERIRKGLLEPTTVTFGIYWFRENGKNYRTNYNKCWTNNGKVLDVRVWDIVEFKSTILTGTGTGGANCTTHRKSGQYLREYSNHEYKQYTKGKQKDFAGEFKNWGCDYTPIQQPKRSWKRSKIKRQYMKNMK